MPGGASSGSNPSPADDGASDGGAGDDGASASEDRSASTGGGEDRGPRREVVVPLALYKTVTVFSTLFAVVLVVGGMVALDRATGGGTAEPDEVSLPIAAAGILAIVLGAGVYAFSTRFRAEGMGNPKGDTDEGSDDG